MRHNHRFHSLIYTGAHNPTLASLVDNLRLRLQPFRNAAFRHQNRIPSSMAEHERIVAALIAAEPEATALALREHIVTSSLYVVEFFNNVRVDGSKVGMLRAGAA